MVQQEQNNDSEISALQTKLRFAQRPISSIMMSPPEERKKLVQMTSKMSTF